MKAGTLSLGKTDRDLLNLLQAGFPLVEEPFALLGEQLGMTPAEALARVQALQGCGVVRSISGIFNVAALGYNSTLAAIEVAPERAEHAAAVISAHPGVSHNYAREHRFNVWFTLALPASEDIERAVAALASQAGAAAYLNLPAIKVYKLRVYFDMNSEGAGPREAGDVPVGKASRELSLDEKRIVKQLCLDMPLVEKPFTVLAQAAGIPAYEFLRRANLLQEQGVMRRCSAVLRHREAGFGANAMTCWSVPLESIDAAGDKACSHKEVSHCYRRPTAPGWRYNLFAMIHGREPGVCRDTAREISRETGMTDYIMLFSSKEYKKEKVRYFASVV